MTIHSDSTSAIARARHTGAGPGKGWAINIRSMVCGKGKIANLVWAKGHEGTPGNEKAGPGWKGGREARLLQSHVLRPPEAPDLGQVQKAKTAWHDVPSNHGAEEIPPPPPKKSCLDNMRNALARAAAQIRIGHWRSAVYLKRIRKMMDDKCCFCRSPARMTRSHAFLHCPNERLRARAKAWEGKDPGVSGCCWPIPGGRGGLLSFWSYRG
jgi:hypothetical protein